MKQFNEKAENLLSLIQHEKYAYLLGDFNICLKSKLIENDLQNQYFHRVLLSYYYNKLITVPTRVDEGTQTSSLIDNIYTNIPESDADMSRLISVIITQYSMFTETLIE